jgi:hypothetical protein
MQTFFQNSYVSFFYDQHKLLGKAVWRGTLQGPELREAYLLLLDMVDRYNLKYWLADNRQMEGMTSSDLDWTIENYVPQITESSLVKVARIPSKFDGNTKDMEKMVSKGYECNPNLIIREFLDEDEAIQWLLNNISE